jgi:hypothetical protein
MVRVETTIDSKNHIPFSIPWASTGQASLSAKAQHAASARDMAARGLNLSGYQLLSGCAVLALSGGVFLWALKLWLFQP